MVHITNGGSAAGTIRAAELPGDVITWDDVLHDGPVPADISFKQLRAVRARFIADCGWATLEESMRRFAERDTALERALDHNEITLWFEHDLYDQLQLLQLLDWFATCELGATRLSLVCGPEYLGSSTPARLRERFPLRTTVTDAQLELARDAWAAFRAADPTDIEHALANDTAALPFLAAALRRHLEQFPSTRNGLARAESQALDAIARGVKTLGDAFVASREDPVYLGDLSFAMYVASLSNTREPLLLTSDGGKLTAPGRGPQFWKSEVVLTDAGRAVLTGERDHVQLNGIDRWLGGVQLSGDESMWRWDPAERRLRRATAS
ncbi:MAG TPA: DUF1835 domain-containing protein [Gemmatimonadaceae bacterium]|nr:DUF1835 domain-containing protein [Gemmatimonadaceae bacterium]